MLQTSVESDKFQVNIEKAIGYVKNLGFDNIKARHDDYESPAELRMQGEDKAYMPDITGEKHGGKFYFEIANRSDDTASVISKWKLMSTLAAMKNGTLRIFVPYGSMKFTTEILEEKNIQAEIIKLKKD